MEPVQTSYHSYNINNMKKSKNSKKKQKASKVVSVPRAFGSVERWSAPRMSASDGGLRIKHREYLGEVNSVTGLEFATPDVRYLEINPGLVSAFPWLSAIANRFDYYTLNSVRFHFSASCGTMTAGSVILAPDYDVSDYTPESVFELQTMQGTVRTSAWKSIDLTCSPPLLKNMVKERLVRSGAIEAVSYSLYDSMVLYYATVGFTGGINVGSLWVEYDVSLRSPSIDNHAPTFDSARLYAGVPQGADKANLLGSITTALSQDVYSPLVERVDSNAFKFRRAGEYLIEMIVTGTGLNAAPPGVTVDPRVGALGVNTGIVDTPATAGWYQYAITILRPGLIRLAATAAWTSVNAMSLKVAPYKGSYSL